ncbi:MAG TPA: GDP-L-fucose synthase [Candidatus Polarisedimenticolia bacterium]|jgi:GDP-L-fucose synthase
MPPDWLQRRICVTGGAGFLGRAVVEKLTAAGCRDLILPRSGDCDLREMPDVRRLFGQMRPDVLVHLAGRVGGIGANRQYPGTFFRDNLMMGVNILDAAREFGVSKTVVIGTICSYPRMTPVPFREEDLWNGYPEETNAPYGISKKALLVMMQAYRREFGLRGIYLMPVNLYGPHDKFDPEQSHVIPALIRKCLQARRSGAGAITCWGSGSATREFLYVYDCADAILAALEKYEEEAPVNIGSGREISIKDLARLVADLTGFRGEIRWDTAMPDGQPRRCLDTSRALRSLGWQARTSLEDGLRETVRWYERETEAL